MQTLVNFGCFDGRVSISIVSSASQCCNTMSCYGNDLLRPNIGHKVIKVYTHFSRLIWMLPKKFFRICDFNPYSIRHNKLESSGWSQYFNEIGQSSDQFDCLKIHSAAKIFYALKTSILTLQIITLRYSQRGAHLGNFQSNLWCRPLKHPRFKAKLFSLSGKNPDYYCARSIVEV